MNLSFFVLNNSPRQVSKLVAHWNGGNQMIFYVKSKLRLPWEMFFAICGVEKSKS